MKRIIFTILLFLFAGLPAFAASWTQVESGTIQTARAIVRSSDNLIAVGSSGNAMLSSDGGTTWQGPNNISSQWLFDVEKLSNGQVMAVGQSGAVLLSSDDGKTWSPSSLGTYSTLNGIDTANGASFVVGNDGVLFYAPTVGSNWTSATTNIITHLYGVNAIDAKTIYAVGANGKIIWSPTGGVGWNTLTTNTGETFRGVAFVNSTIGYVVGTNGTIFKTVNSGSTWQAVVIDGINSQNLYGIQASADKIVIVGDKVVALSLDQGATWTTTSYIDERLTFYDAHIDSNGTIWIAGTKDDVKSVIMKWETVITPTETTLSPEPVEGDVAEALPNSLIKLSCVGETKSDDPCRSVYFYASDGRRHAFPNEKVFYTWFDNFNSVKEVSKTFMSSLSLGKNVTYHPGTKMVKFQSVLTVYAVSKGGVLRAISSEQIASELYGTDWNQKIDDVSDAFFGNYTFGEKINSASDYNVAAETASVASLDENF